MKFPYRLASFGNVSLKITHTHTH